MDIAECLETLDATADNLERLSEGWCAGELWLHITAIRACVGCLNECFDPVPGNEEKAPSEEGVTCTE